MGSALPAPVPYVCDSDPPWLELLLIGRLCAEAKPGKTCSRIISYVTPTGTGRIRVFKMAEDGETRDEHTAAETTWNIPGPVELFVEEVHREESNS